MKSKAKSPFKTLHGKRVLVPFPEVEKDAKKSTIIMPDGIKDEHNAAEEAELIKKYLRIPVVQVGTDCEKVKEGDEIFIPARCLAPGRAESLDIEGFGRFYIIAEQDIAGTYSK